MVRSLIARAVFWVETTFGGFYFAGLIMLAFVFAIAL